MSAPRKNAFFLSLILHATLGACLVFFSFLHSRSEKPQPHLFELVAGPGDNYAALEAPLGTDSTPETPIRFDLPEPLPSPEPPTLAPEPEPAPPEIFDEPAREIIPTTPPEPAPRPEPKPETRPTPAPPPPKPVAKPTPKPAPKPEPKPMTKAEFDRLHGNKPNPTAVKPGNARAAPPRVRQISTRGIVGGSASVSTGAGGTALSRAESDLLDAYISLLRQRLRAAHSKPAGLSDQLQTKVRFAIGADGTLSNLRIITSSGSREFDESVLAAFRKVRSIGPTPNGKSDTWELTFKLTDAT
ncbi:hypothetical protein AXK11_04770 [Cephaloticoccus primus]|uniref:TonB C-terminal domain-containing protein n=1 Tax=Cephaloticoccus primus TaxID=1548207 RepID=A0A139SN60_9BACT|nr:energy transducer TonB [Cephaloticoccus primus]KXU35995.1 hypothetical protein AXK11_04770 [Cephaloticoccus primus]